MASLTTFVTALAVALGAGDTTATREEFQEWGNQIEGRWIGDVKLIADWPGLNRKQGEEVVAYSTTKWIVDGRALVGESMTGDGTSQTLHFWDPTTKQIRMRMVSSGGETWEAVIWRKDAAAWNWQLEGSLLDGTKEHGSGEIVFENGGSTYVVSGTSYLGDQELPPLKDTYRRVGSTANQSDRVALTELLEATVRSLNEQNLDANKRLFTEDGDHINPMGRASRGQEEISAMMADAYRQYSAWKSRCRALETRFLKPDVAIEVREWTMVEPPKGLTFVDPSLELLVSVKRADQWRIFAARPMIPFRPERQVMPGEIPTAAGFSDPAFVEEVKNWEDRGELADDVIVIGSYGDVYRGRTEVQKYLDALQAGRKSLRPVVNSARRLGEDIAIVDWAFEADGKWTPPNRGVIEGTVRGLWCAVYSHKNGQWVLEAATSVIPYIPAK